MKISIINVTTLGNNTVAKLTSDLSLKFKNLSLSVNSSKDKDFNFKECCKVAFENYDAIIFISSTGIAVRGIAPHVVNKKNDPAVVVVDSACKYAISLLSGHLGGANKLTNILSEILDCEAVITTATDNLGISAPDMVAVDNNLHIEDMKAAKEIATLLVEGKTVGFLDEEGKISCPKGYFDLSNIVKLNGLEDNYFESDSEEERNTLNVKENYNVEKQQCESIKVETSIDFHNLHGLVVVTSRKEPVLPENLKHLTLLKLIRKNIVLGIGCKKNYPSENMKIAVKKSLLEKNLHEEAVTEIATVSIKKEEAAILDLCEELGVKLKTFGPEEIKHIEHKYAASDFVRKTIGVGAVCEPVIELSKGEILHPKESFNGMTLAIGKKL